MDKLQKLEEILKMMDENVSKKEFIDAFEKVVNLVSAIKKERSEEHTSELQSHSFISYAVFCLKKKTKKNK